MSDMINRQDAIDEIKQYITHLRLINKRRIKAFNAMELDIESILKQLPSAEPHTFTVIDAKTGKEADTYKIALKEEWAKGLCYCDMEGFAIGEDGTLMLLDECGNCAYCPEGRFEVEWDG